MPVRADIVQGDCVDVLKGEADDSFDLIFTSPPYADRRAKTYGGIKPDKYVEWFIPRAEQFLRVLKPTGTFVLNIKEKVEKGERHTYVLELILALAEAGVALDGGVHLAQAELPPGEVAQPVSRCVGAVPAVQ